jgi:hypothetical protein
MISRMTMGRPQQRYDHRLRQLVQCTGDLTIATDLGVPRSTARGWLTAPTVSVSLDVANLTELELRQELLSLRRRVQKLAALLRPRSGPAARLRLHVGRASGYPMVPTSCESCGPSIRPAHAFRCRPSCGCSDCPPSRFHVWQRRQCLRITGPKLWKLSNGCGRPTTSRGSKPPSH